MGKVRWGLFLLLALEVCRGWASDGRCSIPLQLRRGVPFAHVMVNGHGPYTFAVDTGTSREAIVSPALAKELSLPVVGRTWLLDLTGKARHAVDEVVLEEIELPGHAFRMVRAMVHEPLSTLGTYDGVLGFALFRQNILTLDFPGRCLGLENQELAEGSDPDVLPFSTPRNVPVIVLTIGGEAVPAQIDSAGGGINLPRSASSGVRFARHSEVLVRAESQVSNYFLHGGVMKGDVSLGEHVFRQPFVEIGDDIPVGNLGASSLKDFAITFDQAKRLVRFQAHRKTHRLDRSQLDDGAEDRARDGQRSAMFPGGN